MTETPKVGLATIIQKDNKVLLGKRIGSHGKGTWGFPGGHVELFEDFWTCGPREVKEETGLEIELIEQRQLPYTRDMHFNEKKDYLTFFQKAKYIGGEPKIMEPEKCSEWEWFEWEKLPEPLFLPIQNLIKQGYTPFD